jgi:hypothetical protein
MDHALIRDIGLPQCRGHLLRDVHQRLALGGGHLELEHNSLRDTQRAMKLADVGKKMEVEVRGFEPLAFALRTRRSPN